MINSNYASPNPISPAKLISAGIVLLLATILYGSWYTVDQGEGDEE